MIHMSLQHPVIGLGVYPAYGLAMCTFSMQLLVIFLTFSVQILNIFVNNDALLIL